MKIIALTYDKLHANKSKYLEHLDKIENEIEDLLRKRKINELEYYVLDIKIDEMRRKI
jgi:hypothetical protein